MTDQYGKYRAEKLNGKPVGRSFVLDYDTDPYARVALAAYADSCEADHPQLAADLRAALAKPGPEGEPASFDEQQFTREAVRRNWI
jgi:hypothetical protein